MIIDKLSNAHKYDALHPSFKLAFDFLLSHDLLALPAGKIELDGTNVVINVNDFQGKDEAHARMERHRDFIDIQLPVNHKEHIGWTAFEDLKEISQPYDAAKDVEFYADKAAIMQPLPAGHFAILFPEDGHQPGIAAGASYRKIIVKVRE